MKNNEYCEEVIKLREVLKDLIEDFQTFKKETVEVIRDLKRQSERVEHLLDD